jgi:hypothetical protein
MSSWTQSHCLQRHTETAYAILARSLGFVQRGIRILDESILIGWRGERTDADTDGLVDLSTRVLPSRYYLTNLHCSSICAANITSWEYNTDLLTTVSAGYIIGPNTPADRLGYFPQYRISNFVTVGIIYLFEIIQVDETKG